MRGGGRALEAPAHAKVNLRHRVFGREESGYHGVETLLARTSLVDRVALRESPNGRIELEVTGALAGDVPAGPENLCFSAAARFFEAAFPRRGHPGVRIELEKRIPVGSGLGGGSADAGAVLRLLADRWPRLEARRLTAIAGELGSDVPFALLGVPLALGWERGRRLLPLRPPAARPALLVCPEEPVSTPAAYGWLAERRAGGDEPGSAAILPGPTRLARWSALERLIGNDLEAPVLERRPRLARSLGELRERAPGLAGMTGSGSALFAIFEDEAARAAARKAVEADGVRCFDVLLPV